MNDSLACVQRIGDPAAGQSIRIDTAKQLIMELPMIGFHRKPYDCLANFFQFPRISALVGDFQIDKFLQLKRI